MSSLIEVGANQGEGENKDLTEFKLQPENTKPLETRQVSAVATEPVQQAASSQPVRPVVKAVVAPPAGTPPNATGFTAAQVLEFAKIAEQAAKKAIKENRFDPSKDAQVMLKEKAPITDFSKLTQDDIFNLDIPMSAKPFMDADILKVTLKDTNYEARWVNKNAQNMGNYISKGFRYVTKEDLFDSTALEVAIDSEGHYSYGDVVCMMIDKATYYMALRHAHIRAISTTNQTEAATRGAAQAAQSFKHAGLGTDFENARRQNKMEFYTPGVEV